ncbi:MAG: hypothetical protein V3V08_23280 [Nannocystaceae bacterium]
MSNRLDARQGIKYQSFKVASNSDLELAMGNVTGHTSVNKHGRAPLGVQQLTTDIWDRADAVPTQRIWDAPTEARVHTIVSSLAGDDGDPVGVGARTIRVYGLKDWDTAETSEVLTMNGTTGVVMADAYVIIHRMEVLTKGATSTNVGTIIATAATDTSITAAILPGVGRTQMAIFGFPSTQTFYMTNYYASLRVSGGAASSVDVSLDFNPEPNVELTNFRTVHTRGVIRDGESAFENEFHPSRKFVGPGIIKINCLGSVDDLDVSAGFDGVLVDN